MGWITTCYLQQASGNLLDILQSDTPNLDSAIQNVRDIFALTTKSLDQTARTGAFHHMIRRRATMYDTADGIFGSQFDAKMKEKTDRNKQLAQVLPDTKRVTLGSQLGKRKPTATNTSESTYQWEGGENILIQEWESITDDQWVLKTLQEGLKLEFQETPHLTGIKHTSVNARNLSRDREKTLRLLIKLGFIVNLQKSSLIPSQEITYIGVLFNFKKEIISPTMERILKLEMLVRRLMKGQNTARDYLMLLGLIASCIELIPNARLYMRPIQLHLLHFWKPSTRDLTYQIPFTQHLKDHLNWWLDRANTTKGKSLHQWSATVTITTDASKTGFGGHMNNHIFQGFWSVQEQKQHINLLELEAVIRTVQHFLPQFQNQNVLLKYDNTTVVQYVNKQGGHQVNTPLLQDMVSNENGNSNQSDIQSSSYGAGKLNILADHLSRNKIQPTEWTLNNQIVQSVFAMWGEPTIDLFASVHNHKRPMFCAWLPHPSALAVDALSISWEKMCISTNMSNSKGIKTHESVQLSTNSDSSNVAKKTLVHRASSKINSKSNKSTNKAKSTVSTKNNHLPSKSRSVQADSLAALHYIFRNKEFSRETRTLLRASWRSGTQQDYACKFKRFHSWCSEREKDPYAATLAECADFFLSHLYTSGLQYRTIAGYRSMLSSLLPPIDNVPIGQHPYIIRLLRGVFNSRPPKVN
ncbi:unnamed protein product [Mytilus coruscus]|uniref:Core-binding (CB) domain-containing protein n=1 Tax=Mytilus coruscus TaxID=42192 RepID=A0A6J8EMT9_MYTCO|nr:unnamed protein product [Mytilus coruscus]